MLPWPVWPLAGQSGLGQNTVARSMSILLALSSGLPRVWLDLRFCYKSASPRFSAELPLAVFTLLSLPFLFSSHDHFVAEVFTLGEEVTGESGRVGVRCSVT